MRGRGGITSTCGDVRFAGDRTPWNIHTRMLSRLSTQCSVFILYLCPLMQT
jgi:hypothetical protein